MSWVVVNGISIEIEVFKNSVGEHSFDQWSLQDSLFSEKSRCKISKQRKTSRN